MREGLRYLLVADGSSDACLRYPIQWALEAQGWYEIEGDWADLRSFPGLGHELVERLRAALELHPSDLVFVHRDAESDPPEKRVGEIDAAIAAIGPPISHVCVVPVRMTEAWLLHDEAAIRTAAGRPRGRSELHLPALRRLEEVADPKSVLRDALLLASETTGRLRKRKLRDFGVMRHRVAELITDYAPLRALEAFNRFERDLQEVLERLRR